MSETNKNAFYVTTPIYYVNGEPHVGSATTTLLADALARYHRLRGDRTFFLTGTDENAQKVADAAARMEETPQTFVDTVSQRYRNTWQFLGISYDDFLRTTEPRHADAVGEVFRRLQAQGDIYAGKYEGWYSVSDETFFRDSEVKDGRAIETGASVERVTEDNYYFRLSAYGDRLLEYIETHPGFLQPDTRRNEVLAFIKGGLRDVAISRPYAGWGILAPDDPTQVVYVWFDAVINYLSATGWPAQPGWDTLWPADVHLVGKEIYTRFHATLWPAMLLALELPLPGTILGHGWWLVRDTQTLELTKGSKSKGNIPTPEDAVAYLTNLSGASTEVGVDALRYYLLRDISFTGDTEFSLDALVGHYNAELANKLGNLLNRTLNMTAQYLSGVVPQDGAARTADSPYAAFARECVQDVDRAMLALDPGAALLAIGRLVKAANETLDTQAPWKRHKEGDAQAVADSLYTALEASRLAAALLAPFLPHTSTLICQQLGLGDAPAQLWSISTQWGGLPGGLQTQDAQPIFPRIDTKKREQPVTEVPATPAPPQATPTPSAAPAPSAYITIDDFAKIELKAARIVTAERIEGATKLLRLSVECGEDEERQILAGIAENHDPADLVGKTVVIVANLQPRKMRGYESQGMLLAATDADGRAILLHPEADVAPGAKVR